MEPVDDILLPPPPAPAPSQKRLRSRHILRVLAVLLVGVAVYYCMKMVAIERASLNQHRLRDALSIAPVFLFAGLLWWYAGRRVDELSRPLFRGKGDASTDVRVDFRNVVWLVTSFVSGFVGLTAITIGAVFATHINDLKKVMPDFFDQLEQRLPQMRMLEKSPSPMIWSGVVLVVIAVLAMALAGRRRRAA